MNDDQRRAFLAVILSGLILFGWQYFFGPKNPVPSKEQTQADAVTSGRGGDSSPQSIPAEDPASRGQAATVSKTLKRDGKYEVTFNNRLQLSNVKNATEKFPFQSILEAENPFEIQIFDGNVYRPIWLEFEPTAGPYVLKGQNREWGITFSGELSPQGKFQYQLTSAVPRKIRFIVKSAPKSLANRPPRQFLILSDKVNRFDVGSEEKGETNVSWFGVDFNYHFFAVTFAEKESVTFNSGEGGQLVLDTNNAKTQVRGNIIFVKKNYDDLVALGENTHLSVDFGYFGILAVPILKTLQFLYNFIPNYGLAIIILTILMKIVTFPLQQKSYKSMKKMQVIQPELAKIKEQFKDDPQRMQKESMDLFKKAGANPLSGCLPLLLQTPIFFAFYKVLYGAVELVGAPFYAWIHDLSLKDPFYILPIIMTVVMFIRQKLTPNTTVDPAQRKVMMFMPLIFGLIMKDLPSGLTLYILVSTLCGIIQQMVVYRFS